MLYLSLFGVFPLVPGAYPPLFRDFKAARVWVKAPQTRYAGREQQGTLLCGRVVRQKTSAPFSGSGAFGPPDRERGRG